jgi:hypothetical protein
MAYPVLILAKSGGGKSSAIRNLNPKETFVFNVCKKQLPFKNASKMYTEIGENNPSGNMLSEDDYDLITKTIDYIDKKRTEIKTIVIDDSQYLIVNEFMRKHSTQGKGNDVFQLYNSIGDHFWNLLWSSRLYRKDLFIFFLHHAEETDTGNIKAKSIGKMLDEKVDIPGMFSFVFYACRDGQKNIFYTQNDGTHPAKTPMGMFSDEKIDNDLSIVVKAIKNYYEGE